MSSSGSGTPPGRFLRPIAITPSTTNSYGLDYFIVDLDNVDEMHLDGLDLQIKENVQDNNVLGVTHQLVGQLGLHRTNPTAHAYGFGITTG